MKPILPTLTLLLAPAMVSGCGRPVADQAATRPYRVGVADQGEIRVVVEETGVVEPERQVVVKSPISGVVQKLHVREGDRVHPGQVLARLVPDLAQANSLSRLRSELAAARIAVERVRRDYQRALPLVGRGLTQDELDVKRTALDQAENQLSAVEDQLRFIQQTGVSTADTAQWARITSPTAGVIILRGVEEGETVVGGTSAFGGGTELFTVADLSALRIKAAINEVDIGKVSMGDSVALTVDAFPDDTVVGVVRLVPPAARLNERVRVFDVEIRALRAGPLRPGMTANVRIRGPVRSEVVRIPVESVFLVEGKPVVYRLAGGEPERVAVRLGLSDLSWVEILDGVSPGDSVALEDPAAALGRARRISR